MYIRTCKPHLCTHTYVHSVVHGNTDIRNYVGTYLSGLLHICTYVRTYMVVGHAGHSYVCHIDDVWLGCITLYIPVWPLSYDLRLPWFDTWHFHLSYSIVTDHWKSTGWKAGQIKQWCETCTRYHPFNPPYQQLLTHQWAGMRLLTEQQVSSVWACANEWVSTCVVPSIQSRLNALICCAIRLTPHSPDSGIKWHLLLPMTFPDTRHLRAFVYC